MHFLFAVFGNFTASAQLTADLLQQYLLETSQKKEPERNYQKEIQDFYAFTQYQTVWIQQKDTTNLTCWLNNLSSAEKGGSPKKYYCKYCYGNGQFTNPQITLEEMTTHVRSKMEEMKMDADTISMTVSSLPNLKRWRKTEIARYNF